MLTYVYAPPAGAGLYPISQLSAVSPLVLSVHETSNPKKVSSEVAAVIVGAG